jgi:hypothetical protein
MILVVERLLGHWGPEVKSQYNKREKKKNFYYYTFISPSPLPHDCNQTQGLTQARQVLYH